MTGQAYRLKDICSIKSGKRIPLGMDFTTEITNYPYIRARDIKGGKIQTDDLIYIDEIVFNKIKKYIIKSGDIAITIVGASVGDVAYAQEEIDGFNLTENAVRLTEFNSVVDGKYLFYVLNQEQYHEYMQTVAGGAAQPKLGIYKVERIKVFLPPLNLQKEIASVLAAYDNLIENNNKRIRLLEQMAENLYKEWFVRFRFPGHEKVGFENGLPKGWKVEKVKNIVKRLPFNRTYKEYELEKEGAVIVIDQSTDELMGYHNNEPSHYANYDEPLLLFGDHSCKFQLMTRNFSLGENVIPYTAKNKNDVNAYWLFYATHKLIQTEEYKRHWGRFTSMKVLVPDIDVQTRFEKIVKTIEMEKNKLITVNSTLSRQRDLLLPRLMSGKLEVKV